MLNRQEILDRFRSIKVWTRGSERAPHKPLLILLALGRIQRGDGTSVRYLDVDEKLRRLLIEFGPPRKSYHPEFPFWHLQTDGLWVVRDGAMLAKRTGSGSPRKSELVRVNPQAGFSLEVADRLRDDSSLVTDVARVVLEQSFPDSLHGDILRAVGLESDRETTTRARRDPDFRPRVLRAYERQCAVCGFDLRLADVDLALEAAHIMWHQAGGPDVESNGLALCSIHHKLFDRGAFTVAEDLRMLVSQDVHGSAGLEHVLLRHHGRPLRPPQSAAYRPEARYLRWHAGQVFRPPPRCA